jgi:hypothetical protein
MLMFDNQQMILPRVMILQMCYHLPRGADIALAERQ